MRAMNIYVFLLIGGLLLSGCGRYGISGSGYDDDSIVSNTTASTTIETAIALRSVDSTEFEETYKTSLELYDSSISVLAGGVLEDADGVVALPVFASADDSAASNEAAFSRANTQEQGVDELDRMRVIQQQATSVIALARVYDGYGDFFIAESGVQTTNQQTYNGVDFWEIQQNTAVKTASITTSFAVKGLYQYTTQSTSHIFALSGSNFAWGDWFTWWGYGGQRRLSISHLNPIEPAALNNIAIDGTLISSRRIDNHLYLVSRYAPNISSRIPHPYSANEQHRRNNRAWIRDANLADLMPTMTINGTTSALTTEACLVSPYADSRVGYIISMSHIDLNDPTQVSTICYTGSARVLYASENALYVGSSRYSQGDYNSRIETTEIHRFALEPTGARYTGSAQVLGGLGWNAQQAAFRLAERDGHLLVVSYLSQRARDILVNSTNTGGFYINADAPSPTMLSVFEIGDTAMTLVNQLPNAAAPDPIGKPDDRIYGVRFTQDELFIVTFDRIDPLYRIDISEVGSPIQTAALEIDGVSDYLHPLGNGLLLGVGYDTTNILSVNTTLTIRQGVKLSLFRTDAVGEVSELETVVIGEQGSYSPAAVNHLAFQAFAVPQDPHIVRFSLPIQVNDNSGDPSTAEDDCSGRTRYSRWYQTALFVYEVDTEQPNPTLTQRDKIVAATRSNCDGSRQRSAYHDRSILSENATYYIHQNAILSSDLIP